MQTSRTTYATWAVASIVLMLALMIFGLHARRDGLVDDAFITYRYAARFATGSGLTYNDGERILGTSTPAYALLLALPARITGPEHIPRFSLTLSLLATLTFMAHTGLIALRISDSPVIAALAVFVLMTSHYTTWVMTTGMEAPVFLALLSGGILGLVYRRWTTGIILFSLLPLIRPEGVFAVGLLTISLVTQMVHQRQNLSAMWLIRHLILLGLPGLVYALVATGYYGTPVPHSITAKSAGLYPFTAADTTALITARLREFVDPLFRPIIATHGPRREAVLMIVSLGIMLAGGYWLARRRSILWIMPALLVILLVFYARSATLLFGWYYAHFDALAVLCFVTGIYALLRGFVRLIGQSVPRWPIVALSMVLLLLIQREVIFENAVRPDATVRQPPFDIRETDYYHLAGELAPHLPAGTTVATPEVGVLGFYLPQVTIVDAAGLVSPQAVAYFPAPESERLEAGLGAVPRGLIHDYRPDIVISFDFFVINSLLADAWFAENYTLVIHQRDLLEHGELLVYSRHDFAPGLALAER